MPSPTSPSISLIISPPSPSNHNDHPLPPDPDDSRSQIPIARDQDTHARGIDGTFVIKHNQSKMHYQQGQATGSGSNGGGQGQGQGQSQGQEGQKSGPRPLRAPAPGPLNIGYSNHQGMSQMPPYQFQNQAQNQTQNQNHQYGQNVQGYAPPGYGQARRQSGGNDISPFQTTGTSLPSGSTNSSPINQFSFQHQHQQPPYINIDRAEPMGARPLSLVPSEPRMGHYSNYPTYPPQQHQGYDQWHPDQNQGHQGQGQGQNEQVSQSRRSTISNPSDHVISRPSTSEAVKVKDMVKIEPMAMEEDDNEEKLDHRKRKRNRTIRSCVPCHNHKRKVLSHFRCLISEKRG